MQFSLKRLFVAVLIAALLALFFEFAIERKPQVSGFATIILAGPALMGFVIAGISIAMLLRKSRPKPTDEETAVSQYKNLLIIGLFAIAPLATYLVYCIAVGPTK